MCIFERGTGPGTETEGNAGWPDCFQTAFFHAASYSLVPDCRCGPGRQRAYGIAGLSFVSSYDQWRIVVGGRPGAAAIAEKASEELSAKGLQARENVAHMVSEELDFENFGPCSEQERRELTIDMMRILIKKAWKGFSRQNSLTMKSVKR